jgi:hypothetical protein
LTQQGAGRLTVSEESWVAEGPEEFTHLPSEELPYFLREQFIQELTSVCRRIRPHPLPGHRHFLRLFDDEDRRRTRFPFPDERLSAISPELLIRFALAPLATECHARGVSEVMAELMTDGETERSAFFHTLDLVQRACDFEYTMAKTPDEEDAILTLKSYCFNLMRDLGGR